VDDGRSTLDSVGSDDGGNRSGKGAVILGGAGFGRGGGAGPEDAVLGIKSDMVHKPRPQLETKASGVDVFSCKNAKDVMLGIDSL
jgi:hypothetical protein